jgi:hypothetical protein
MLSLYDIGGGAADKVKRLMEFVVVIVYFAERNLVFDMKKLEILQQIAPAQIISHFALPRTNGWRPRRRRAASHYSTERLMKKPF